MKVGGRGAEACPPARAAPTLADQIRKRALGLGFDLVGFTSAQPPPHAAEFGQWLADGFLGELGYLARRAAERIEPGKVLPGARSVVVIGLNYNNPRPAALTEQRPPGSDAPSSQTKERPPEGDAPLSPEGRIARYSWGARDYHDLVGEKLAQLAGFIGRLGGQAKWYVDTGPVLERDLAQRAGIGFIGKHTNLISRQLGNWLFLGEVLTDLELPPDKPEQPHCGTCHRCLDACPTRAILAPYRLDARL